MSDHQFFICWHECLQYADLDSYISDLASSTMWNDTECSEIPSERIEQLARIWNIHSSSLRDLRNAARLTQAAMSERFVIPLRTIEDWDSGKRTPPDYVKIMIARSLNLL